MKTGKRLIDMEDALRRMEKAEHLMHNINGIKAVDIGAVRQFFGMLKPVDAVEVVRCEKCVHCVNDEEEPGMCKCVESAEYESESGLWLGFVEYHTPDFFCAYGERKDND